MLLVDRVRSMLHGIRGRKYLVIPVLVCTGVALLYVLFATPKFSSRIEIMPVQSQSSSFNLPGIEGSLASQFLRGQGTNSQAQRNREFLQSRGVAMKFIEQNELLPKLFPEAWDAESKSWIEQENWLGKISDPPNLLQGFERLRGMRRFGFDELSGTISLKHTCTSPEFCAELTREFIRFVNDSIQQYDLKEIDESLEYLSQRLSNEKNPELIAGIAGVYQAQLQQRVHATARAEYAFFTVDPVVFDDRPAAPRKLLVLLLGFGFGLFLSSVLLLLEQILERADEPK